MQKGIFHNWKVLKGNSLERKENWQEKGEEKTQAISIFKLD